MRYFKYSRNSAQSTIEYSLLIAVGVAALIVMQYYFGRSVQGLLKQNVDNLGGEKLSGQQYSPGKWYTGTSVTRIGTSGFEYEGRKGFNVSTGTMQRSQVSKIEGTPDASELPTENLEYETLVNGEDAGLVSQVYGTAVDPGIATVRSNVNNNTSQWSSNKHTADGQDDDSGAGIDSEAEGIVNEYVDPQSINIDE